MSFIKEFFTKDRPKKNKNCSFILEKGRELDCIETDDRESIYWSWNRCKSCDDYTNELSESKHAGSRYIDELLLKIQRVIGVD